MSIKNTIINKPFKFIFINFIIIFFIFIFQLFINKGCLNLRIFSSINDFGISHVTPCISKNNLKNNFLAILKNYPVFYEIGRNVQRKYVSKFNLDNFKIKSIQVTNYEDLPEYKFREGLLSKNTTHKKISNESDILKREVSTWTRSHGGSWNSHFSSSAQINQDNIKRLKLIWKYTSIQNKDLKKIDISNVQTNPVVIGKKIILITGDKKIIALNAKKGSLIWELQPLFTPSKRGILSYRENGIDYLILPIGKKIYKINANTGKLIKKFGNKGYVMSVSKLAPMIYKQSLVIISSFGRVESFNLETGKKLNEIKIHENKNFSGGLPWGGAAIDEKKGIVYVVAGNPRPALYGVNRTGDNKNSSSIIAIDLEKKKIKWAFQDVAHDLWDYDISSPPIIHNLRINQNNFEVVVALTKTGNALILERNTGEPIFDLRYKKAPKSDVYGEVVSDYQLDLLLPEKFSKVEYSSKDFNELSGSKIKEINKKISNKKYGWFEPPSYKKDLLTFGLHGGAQWMGAALDHYKQNLYIPTNNVPYKLRIILQSRYLNEKSFLNSKTKEIFKVYKSKCASCHLQNRNGVRVKKGEKSLKEIPSLVGLTLIDKDKNYFKNLYKKAHPKEYKKIDLKKMNLLFSQWDKYLMDNQLIRTNTSWSQFLTDDDLPASNPPWGYIAKINLETGKLNWKKPVGKKNINGTIKNVGTEIFGGVALNKNGILFITGTDDNYFYAMDSNTGEIIWEYKMNASGSAPPTIFEIDGREYVSVLSTKGKYFSYKGKDSTIYTFAIE